nr:very hypothetical protein SPAC4G9.18c - fission yeast (Schizosaccharomyces pombe) [Schizosaccharomyces pombe]
MEVTIILLYLKDSFFSLLPIMYPFNHIVRLKSVIFSIHFFHVQFQPPLVYKYNELFQIVHCIANYVYLLVVRAPYSYL